MAFTKILGPGIHTLANFHSHNINSSGIITATKFVGDMEPGGGTGSFDSLTVTGNLSVGGTVTYTDVTNVDAIGIITAQSGIYIGVGATVGSLNTTTGISSFKKLNVEETSTFNGSVGIADSIIHIGNTDTSIRFPGDDTFTVETAGSEALRIDSDGYVGIGTNDPATTLHLDASGGAVIRLQRRSTNTTNKLELSSDGTDGTVESTNDILFRAGGDERLRIDSNGRVGINSLSPTTTLDVTGTTKTEKLHVTGISTFVGVSTFNSNITLTDAWGYDNNIKFHYGNNTINFPSASLANIAKLPKLSFGDRTTTTTLGVGDFLMYHDYYNMHMMYYGANGNLVFSNKNTAIYISGANGSGNTQQSIRIDAGAAAGVKLHQAGEIRFETVGIGVSVHGEVATTQDYPNYRPTLDFNFAAVKKLDSRITYQRTGPASYYDEFGLVRIVGDNEPRFDHDPITRESKGLLIEHSRTNLFLYGRTPGDTWTGAKNGTFEENTTETTAPDGTFTATKWTFTNNDPYLYQTTTLSASTTYTMSIWVKAGTNMAGDALQSRIGAAPFASSDYTIPADGSWKRITYTKTVGGSNETSVNVGWEPQTLPGLGVPASGDVIYIWGAQLEVGGYVTSFIPTDGAAVTRGADFTTLLDDDFTDAISQTEGTLIAEYDNVTSDGYVLSLDGSGGDKIGMVNNNGYQLMGTAGGSSQGTTDNGTLLSGTNRFALAYKLNDTAISINGNTATVDTSYTLPTTTFMSIGHRQYQYDQLGSCIARIMYYNKRLPNSQLKTLSTR